MRKLLVVALALGLLVSPATAAPVDDEDYVFAGGGTPLTNGIFFPGTALTGVPEAPPVEVTRGTDFTFVNLDEAAVGNGHKIISFKRLRSGRAAFQSDLLMRPGDTDLVITSHLKPGVYKYYCAVHAGMYGNIEIVNQ
ncbi:MAG: cupredoxin domain-containing protein [Actinomycetota bacterium]